MVGKEQERFMKGVDPARRRDCLAGTHYNEPLRLFILNITAYNFETSGTIFIILSIVNNVLIMYLTNFFKESFLWRIFIEIKRYKWEILLLLVWGGGSLREATGYSLKNPSLLFCVKVKNISFLGGFFKFIVNKSDNISQLKMFKTSHF